MVFSESITFDGDQLGGSIVPTSTPLTQEASVFIDNLRSGDEAAFESLVEEHSGDLFALLFRLTGDREEAGDLVQETFVRVLRSIGGYRGDSTIKTWLYRIAINESRNRFRWWKRRRRDVTFSLDAKISESGASYSETLSDISISPEESALMRERERAIEDALQHLRPIFREAVVLCDVEGLTYEETADTLGIAVGTVKSRIARGREDLRKRLKDY